MTNLKATKRALVSSVLALFLCFAMLLGTTYAWFTDSVSSDNNIIKSGNLDVEMYYAKGDTDPAKAEWLDASKGPIFNNANWEPGYTEAKHIKIANEGSLALKYQLAIIPTGEVEDLAEVIHVYVIKPAAQVATRDAELPEDAYVGTLKDLINDGITTGRLTADNKTTEEVEGVDTLTIVFQMDKNAGNNYMNKKIGDSFTIQLLATQDTVEGDSFDNTYDEDAAFGTYIELNAGDDLLAAMLSGQEDLPLTIKLSGDVEWPTEGHHGVNDITPASSITINGNGYTITATGAGVTPLGDPDAPMTLRNVTIVDKSVSYTESSWEFTYLEIGGPSLTCENVTFADEIQPSTNAIFTNCTFESNEESVYAVWVEGGSATFTNCTFTGYRGLKTHEAYGSEVSSVIVKNCTFDGMSKKPGIAIGNLNADTTVSITGSTFINCQAGDQDLYIYETDTDVTTFDFKAENNTVYVNATIVSTKEELLALSAKALTGNNNKTEQATIVINADIDMQGADFSAIIAQRGDTLNVVGNGHKISNINIVSGANDNTTGQASMFYAYPNSTLNVKDLILENVTVTAEANGSGYAAAILGYCEGTAILTNVDVVNATVTGVKSSGMMVGHLSGTLNAKDCELSGIVTLAEFAEEEEGHYAGKYIGTLAGPATIRYCNADVTVSGALKAANDGEIYGRKTAAGTMAGLNIYDSTVMGGLYELLPTLQEGDTLILPAATYTTSGTFTIPHGVTIKGAEGAEVIIHQTGSAQDNIFNCEGDAVIENITFKSNRKGYAINGAAKNHDTDGDITVINCKFIGLAAEKNWGIYKNLNGDLTVLNCTFDNYDNALCGINNGGDSQTVITGCTFTNINGEAIGYVSSTMPVDFEADVIANNTGLTADNVIGY